MGATTANSDAVLKTVFGPTMLKWLPEKVRLLKSFRKEDKMIWEGRDYVETPAHLGRSESVSAGAEGGPIAEAQHEETVKFQVPLRYIWGRMSITGPAMAASRTNKGSYKRLLAFQQESIRNTTLQRVNRMIWGDGRGVLCLVDVAGTGTTALTVDAPGGVANDNNGSRFLQRNQVISILNSTGTSVLATRKITAVANTGGTVTLNAAVSSTEAPDNGLVVLAPNLSVTDVAHTGYNKEPMGLLGMIDDGTYVNTYFNVNRTTYDAAQAAVFSNTGALSVDVLQQGVDAADQRGDGMIDEYWCHHSVRRAYLAILVANRRYISSGGTNNHDAGFAGSALSVDPEFNGKPIKCDKDAPYGTLFGLDTRGCVNYTNTEFEWIDDDGHILSRTRGVDAFEATFRYFVNFAHERPIQCFRRDGISANLVVVHVR